jgi:hypothetical protein
MIKTETKTAIKAPTEKVIIAKKTYKEIYNEYRDNVESKVTTLAFDKKKLNRKGRLRSIFPQLQRAEIFEFEDFEKAVLEVYNKKSKHSSTVRNLLKELFLIIQYKHQNNA